MSHRSGQSDARGPEAALAESVLATGLRMSHGSGQSDPRGSEATLAESAGAIGLRMSHRSGQSDPCGSEALLRSAMIEAPGRREKTAGPTLIFFERLPPPRMRASHSSSVSST